MVELSEEQKNDLTRMLPEFVRFIAVARDFRRLSDAATADEFFHLLEFERREDVWKRDTGIATFAAVLTRFNLRSPERYETFKESIARFGADRVRAIGVDQCAEIVSIPAEAASISDVTKRAVEAVIEEVFASCARNGGTSPSPRNVVSIRGKHWQKPVVETKPRDQVIIDLQARITKLEKEKKVLVRKLDVAERKLARAEERWTSRVERPRFKNAKDPRSSSAAPTART